MRRRAHLRDRRGIRPDVGGTGRVADLGRHRRHTYLRAPESRLPARRRARARDSLKSRRATYTYYKTTILTTIIRTLAVHTALIFIQFNLVQHYYYDLLCLSIMPYIHNLKSEGHIVNTNLYFMYGPHSLCCTYSVRIFLPVGERATFP